MSAIRNPRQLVGLVAIVVGMSAGLPSAVAAAQPDPGTGASGVSPSSSPSGAAASRRTGIEDERPDTPPAPQSGVVDPVPEPPTQVPGPAFHRFNRLTDGWPEFYPLERCGFLTCSLFNASKAGVGLLNGVPPG